MDSDLVALPRLLGLLAVRLQRHLHLGVNVNLKVSRFLHLQPVLPAANCLGVDRHGAAHGRHHENPHHRSQDDHCRGKGRIVQVCTVSRSLVHCGRRRLVVCAAGWRRWSLAPRKVGRVGAGGGIPVTRVSIGERRVGRLDINQAQQAAASAQQNCCYASSLA